MSFKKEPPYTHGALTRTAIVLVNLGTPEAPTARAVRRYLRQFLSDPRVVELPRVLWWLILNLLILPFRARKSALKYAMVWQTKGSPLKLNTERQADLLRSRMQARGHRVQVAYAMRYGQPALPAVLDRLKAEGCERMLILPAYPQYSGTTTASIFDAVFAHFSRLRNVPELRLVKHYHDHEGYIQALTQSVLAHWEANGQPDKLVMSFHGTPKRTLQLGDPYHCECHKTARLLAAALHLDESGYVVSFQSRFGKAEWLQPYTVTTLQALARQGVGCVDVICPGFISDCLETLEEIAIEAKAEFLQAGGKQFRYIPCLNDDPAWGQGLMEIAEQHIIGWPTVLGDTQCEKQQADISSERHLQLSQ